MILVLAWGLGCAPKKPIERKYSTPEQTFETWRQAAVRLDLPTLLTCYASSQKSSIENELQALSEEGLKAMQKEADRTDFRIEKIIYEKDKAYLRTSRKIGKAEDIEVLVMIKEGLDWKLLP